MNPWLLYTVAAIYAGIAVQYLMIERYGMAVAFIAYAVANICFAWDARLGG